MDLSPKKLTPEDLSLEAEKLDFGLSLRSRIYSKPHNVKKRTFLGEKKFHGTLVALPHGTKKKADLRENDEHSPPLKKRKPVTKTTGKQDDLLLDDDTPMEGVVHLRSPDAFKDTQETNGRRKLRTLAADKKAVSRKLQPLEPDFSKKQIKKKRKDPFWFIKRIRQMPNSQEFVYLNIVQDDPLAPYNPYHLEIVPHSEINKDDYCTMSAHGVIRVCGSDSDFITLEQWEREYEIFHKILQIRFFKQFRVWKAFTAIRKKVVWRKINKAKQELTNTTFHLNNCLRDPLLAVRKICLDITKLELYKDNKGETLTLENFTKVHQVQKLEVQKQLKNMLDQITKIVAEACRNYMTSKGFGDKIKDIDKLQTEEKSQFTPRPSSRPSTSRGPSVRKLNPFMPNQHSTFMDNEPFQMSYTELSQKKTECRRLMSYIRLCEHLIYDALIVLHTSSVKAFLDKLSRLSEIRDKVPVNVQEQETSFQFDFVSERDENNPLFRTEVLHVNDNLSITPTKDDFASRIDKIIAGFFEAIQVERLLKKKVFEEYLVIILNDRGNEIKIGPGPNLKSIISKEKYYKQLLLDIRDTLFNNYREIEEYASTFGPLNEMYLQNKKMDIQKIRESDPPLKFFKSEMKKYKEQNEAVEKMPTGAHKGIFFVDTKKLKELFIPSPKNCLKALHDLLPVLAKEKNDILYKEIKVAATVLQQPPTTVEKFVDYLQFTSKISSQMESIERRFNHVSNIYKLLELEKVEVPPDDRDRFTVGTVSTFSTLRTAISLAEDSREDRIAKFSVDLDRRLEDLRNEVKSLGEQSRDDIVSNVDADIDEVIEYLTNIKNAVENARAQVKTLQGYQEMFNVQPEEMEELDPVTDEVKLKLLLWESRKTWAEKTEEWTNQPFKSSDPKVKSLDVNLVKADIEQYSYIVGKVQQGLSDNPVVPKLAEAVEKWQVVLPVLVDLKNPALKPRHWKTLDHIIGKPLSTEKTFTLGDLLELNIVEKRKKIEDVSHQASQEASLEELLRNVKNNWQRTEFEIKQHKEWYIIGDTEDIRTLLEDDSITISTILCSPNVTAIKSQVEEWENNIRLMMNTLREWVTCQRKWLYLESVFSQSTDIQLALKEDAQLFFSVDRFFKEVMKKAKDHPNVFTATTAPGLYDKFVVNVGNLDKIEKSLQRYLGQKRDMFPRFYFLSDADLLDILSKAKDPQAVQPHLLKCFENIKRLEFDKVHIKAMISAEDEVVPLLSTTLKARGAVEEWLDELERTMRSTVKELIKRGIKEYPTQIREDWLLKQKAQIAHTVTQIYWCREVSACLQSENPIQALKEYEKKSQQTLTNLAILARSKLTKLQRRIIGTMIIIDVHALAVVRSLIEEGVTSVTDFGWLKQLKYYWDNERNDCFIQQSNSEIKYGYEYLGCQSRLVITPLTDRIYMTLTGALHLKLGGAPAGPAGTGKTETVKDLAKVVAIQCVVYNCSEGVTYEMMSKFFSGIVQTGAWTCFDEFNRINIEVLSVIASQLQTIQDALRSELEEFIFDERELKLKPSCGIFITMNPGYAGRTELPDNLKALFRPVAVMIPDYGLIAEVMLFSEGFENASVLSKKMVQLYKLSNEQLSAQDHYDFGMRAVKSVLVMAGELKRSHPNDPEDIVLIRAMRDSNIPKFVGEDVALFNGIVSDLFPTAKLQPNMYGDMQTALEKVLQRENLQQVSGFMLKVFQLYETMIVRHGVMLVGPAGGGKTTVRKCLALTMEHLANLGITATNGKFCKVIQYVLNPKSIKYSELYGTFNRDTGEWFDGLIPHFARAAVNDRSETEKWLVFDGPVDTLWIESMNSVLDDSKLLCLDNTERIKLTDDIHLLFEVQDLSVASPATVSRCGMVYVDPNDLGYMPIVKSWLSRKMGKILKDEHKQHVLHLFEGHVENGLKFVKENCKQDIEALDINIVTSLCDLFHAMIVTEKVALDEMDDLLVVQCLNNIFMFCYVWSLGGNIVTKSRPIFDKFVRKELAEIDNMPKNGSVYDFYIDFKSKSFGYWKDKVPNFTFDKEQPYFQIMVPTTDTVTFAYMLRTLMQVQKPVLFNGNTGVGKSVIVTNTLTASKDDLCVDQVTIQFSAQTTSGRTQEAIESKLIARRNVLRPPPGRKIALFIDDLNMPQKEEFGAQPPIELIRQMLGYGGFYDVKDRVEFTFKIIQDVVTIAACGPPGGGRNPTTPQLLRLFHMFCIPDLSTENMSRIFNTIFSGFLQPFSEEVKNLCQPIVKAAVELYVNTCETFRPTPSTAHYTFNLRDLSKVFQGMLQTTPSTIRTVQQMVRLFVHESMRCFHDRLVNETDRKIFKDSIIQLLNQHIKTQRWDYDELFVNNPIIFGDFSGGKEICYTEVKSYQKLASILDNALGVYNMRSPNKMDLVFFADAARHAARIVRIIKQERGNALLVGVGGSGKQSLTRLAASIANYELFEIKLRRGYDVDDFREDLQTLYRMTGVEGKKVVFLFSDTQITKEAFLEDINNILNSGEVPNLFPPEDREQIINSLRPAAAEAKIADTREAIYNFFIQRVQNNLHIVLCMSPVGENFRTRTRMLPSLVNCCTIDWFDVWPQEALKSVAERKLLKTNLGKKEIKDAIIDMCVLIHTSVVEMAERMYNELRRRYYLTPASYLSFLSFYQEILEKQKVELTASKLRLTNGVTILKETNEKVEGMQKELEALQPILKQKTIETKEVLKQVTEGAKEVAEQRKIITQEEKVIREKTEKAEAIANEANAKLAEAIPALQKAMKAVEVIDKGDIAEIKRYQTPAPEIVMVLSAVGVLFGYKEKDLTWANCVQMMSESGFVKRCIEYDKDNIPEKVIAKVKKIAKHPNFNEDVVGTKSKAAKSLCMWVLAMCKYYDVNKEITPLRELQAKAQAELDQMRAALNEKQEAVAKVEARLAELNKRMETLTAEKEDLEERTAIAERRLNRAKKLTTSLADEYERWQASVKELDTQINDLTGNVFLGAACIAYYGAFPAEYRRELVAKWEKECRARNIPISQNWQIQKILSTPVQIRDWNIAGLPTDQQSTENAILVTMTGRWPLMIDPQGQANNWIRTKEKMNGLKVIKLTDPNYLKVLDSAIRLGTPVLLEDIGETIDPALNSLLEKQIQHKAGRMVIMLGDTAVDYDPKFRFYITTKLANPHYLPDICIKVTLINFTVTQTGLEDQLLGDVCRKLLSKLEEQKDNLVVSVAEDKKMLLKLEQDILTNLEQSKGTNILDNEKLIKSLDDSKFMSNMIVQRVQDAEKTERELDATRELYRPVAVRGSLLYFVMSSLSLIDNMYQYSLEYFKKLFNMAIDQTEKTSNLEVLIPNLILKITETIYNNICRGLFEKDKQIFSFLIASQILRSIGEITYKEWNYFLRGALVVKESQYKNPDPKTISEPQWNLILSVDGDIPEMEGIAKSIVEEFDEWEKFRNSQDPFHYPLHGEWNHKIKSFQKLILMKCLCLEKVSLATLQFVAKHMGKQFTEPPPRNLEKVLLDTTSSTPIVFILSQGADPTEMLRRFAAKKHNSRLNIKSLGQGQEESAKRMIEKGKKDGDWVLLQNCHLAISFMPELERIIGEFNSATTVIDPNFRLWLTSMPDEKFPIPILQNSIKLTNEPPKGIRNNLRRSYEDITEDYFNTFKDEEFPECEKKIAFRKLLFGLCMFHAIIQERKKFGPLGWNIKYEFNESDLNVSKMGLQMFLSEQETIPWDSLKYVIGEINYGGRVTDPWDRRCILSILKQYFTKDILNEECCFSKIDKRYTIPHDGDLAVYKQFINDLPEVDDPELFSMHENANIVYQLQETDRTISTILSIQPRTTSSKEEGGDSSEELVRTIAQNILKNLPEELSKAEAGPTTFEKTKKGTIDSLSTVLYHEMLRYNKLLSVMRFDLEELLKAMDGLTVMSAELETMFRNLLDSKVPELWSKKNVIYPSLKPLGMWIDDLQERIKFLRNWLRNGKPKTFWISGFFFPQGFLTGVLQTFARKYEIAIDTLDFKFHVLDCFDESEIEAPPSDGVYIRGLYIDGARWDTEKRVIAESRPGEMSSKLPIIHFLPEVNHVVSKSVYRCPLYKTSVRYGTLSSLGQSTNFVVAIELPVSKEHEDDYWVLQGVAALCQDER